MAGALLSVLWEELHGFWEEQEGSEYFQHVQEWVAALERAFRGEEEEAVFAACEEQAHAQGRRLAQRQVEWEQVVRGNGQLRQAVTAYLWPLLAADLRQAAGESSMAEQATAMPTKWVWLQEQLERYGAQLLGGYQEQQQVQLARASREQYSLMLDSLPCMIVIYDADERCVFVNQLCCEINQTTPEQVVGRTRQELTKKYNHSPEPPDVMKRVMAGERVCWRVESITEEGLVLNEQEIVPFRALDGTIAGVVSVSYPSVSEKERLFHLQKQFSFVLNSMNSGLLIFNREHAVTGVNKKLEEILGVEAELILGRGMEQLYVEHVEEEGPNNLDALFEVMDNGLVLRDVERKLRVDGRNMSLRISGNPIRNAHDMPVGYILIIDDLTELMAMREAMFRNEKFALIGQFAAGIAHEIRNPLTTVFGFLQLYGAGSVQHENFLELTHKLLLPEIERANGILSDFLMVSKPQAPVRASVETASFLVDVMRIVESEAHLRDVMLRVDVPTQLPSLHLDVQQMKQVFLNLCKNSFDVMEPGTMLTLRAQVIEGEDGGEVRFEVIDQGPGIPANVLPHIFEPFYTTKEEGTGLGLPISHRIVEGHGGSLGVRSTEGVGTTFTISIPYRQ